MRPASFGYIRPTSIAEASQALAEGATALAGGQSLLPLLKSRAVRPTRLVDLNRIPELAGVTGDGGNELVIGAMTRHQDIADNALVRSALPLLASAARCIGDVQVRARGTIGGNVCFADPRANMSTALVALEAEAELVRVGETRRVPVAETFADVRESARRPDELLTRFHLRRAPGQAQSTYLEFAPQRNGVPVVNVAVVPGNGDGRPRIAIGGLLRTPCRATEVEDAISGQGAAPEAIRRGIDELVAGRRCYADSRGDAAYRARVAAVLVARVFERAARQEPGTREQEY